ncbi:MAG: VOC family protein [Chloroflexota bacterium]|nr:VOC family protein [Chloroflexota bacterium]MDE2951563.1 VOC family protein [Chloroflexota bacterium]
MILGIDHIVIAARELNAAMETYRGLGFSVVYGGAHPYGSHNALIGFEDGSYIELLGFYEESPAHPWWELLHERGGGLIDFCLATDDIRADLAAIRAQGVEAGDLTEGGRRRPDGYEVKWINNKVGGEFQGIMPFIIEDVSPRAQRLPRETTQANGATGIHCLSLATEDAGRYGAIMGAVLGQEGQAFRDDELGASGIRFELGSHFLEYLSPSELESPLRAHLARDLPAPYRVSFKTRGPSASFGPEQTEGVRIELK